MEQRILQYRKQIDEWLTEMEQNVQTLSQHGEYSTQAVQRQTHTQKTDTEKTDIKKTDTEEQTMQEMVQDKRKEHLVQVGFVQHERLIHLIVTVTFALLEMLAIVISVISDSLFTLLLPIVILILLIRQQFLGQGQVITGLVIFRVQAKRLLIHLHGLAVILVLHEDISHIMIHLRQACLPFRRSHHLLPLPGDQLILLGGLGELALLV